MKITELKKIITEELGEVIGWSFTNIKTYTLNFDSDRRRMREEILKELSLNPYTIQNVIEPDEDMQMIVLRQNLDYIKLIKNPTEKVIKEAIKNIKIDYAYNLKYILRFLENDLKEEQTIKLSELKNMTLKQIKELLNKNMTEETNE